MNSFKIVKAYRADGTYSTYKVPSLKEAIEHSKATWGVQYDRHERKNVEGGEAMLWERISSEPIGERAR